MLSKFYVREHIKSALQEDIGFGDITTENLAGENDFLKAELNTRNDGVLCGCEVFKQVFDVLSGEVEIKFYFKDGDLIKKGDKIADLKGPAKDVLMGERLALNYIQRLSGIATETRKYQDAIKPYHAKIVDTRKTTPNFRAFEKYSVFTGGGALHRFNLSDCAMIKDNHIKLAGSITEAVRKLREKISFTHKIEVECDTFEQVKEAVECGADIIMLDNMPVDLMKQAVEYVAAKQLSSYAAKSEECQRAGSQEVKLFNNSSIDKISQQPLTETNYSTQTPPHPQGKGVCHDNLSTLQPFNPSTDTDLSPYSPIALSPLNSHTSIPPYLHTSKIIVEASGNVNLDTVNSIASTGVDIISSSAIVAKAPTLDLALDIE